MPEYRPETMKISDGQGSFAIINKADYNPDTQTEYKEGAPAKKARAKKAKKAKAE